MNSNIRDNNDLGIIIIYHFNNNKFNNIDVYVDTIFVFCCEIDNNGQKISNIWLKIEQIKWV